MPRLGLLPPVVAMYGDVVLELKPLDRTERDPFEVILEKKKRAYKASLDTELPVEALRELVRDFKAEEVTRPERRAPPSRVKIGP